MKNSDTTKNLDAALFKIQATAIVAVKGKRNEHFKQDYADLDCVWQAVRPALQECGILIRQAAHGADGERVTVTTRLVHVESGEFVESDLTIKPAKAGAQEIGSAITYARRYAILAALGIVNDDDDGADASRPALPQGQPQRTTPPITGGATREYVVQLLKQWTGLPSSDLGAAARLVKDRLGIEAEECEAADFSKMAKFIGEQRKNKVDFLAWSKNPTTTAPAPAAPSNGRVSNGQRHSARNPVPEIAT